jgi:ADP-heptose:LPS heptosyltransferase
LGDGLAADLGLTLVIAGGASERALAQGILDIVAAPAANLAGRTSLEDLICLLAEAEVVVAGDTGPLHLAAALGTPVVGIYGPTDPANTGPLSERAEVVRLGVACSPCYDLRTPADCKLPDRSTICMTDLAPPRVFAAVTRVLGRAPAAARMLESG